MSNGPLYQPTRTRRDLNALTAEVAAHMAAPLEDHDHSGDEGDGGTFDAANLTSGAAPDGQVLTADGAGGAAWEAVSALADHDHSGDPGDGGQFNAANLNSGMAASGTVLTCQGFGVVSWAELKNHDHSGDSGDGGPFDAANLQSGAAPDGQVLTADGLGGAGWEALPALADHDHSGDPGDGGAFDASNLASGIASNGQLLTADGLGQTVWRTPANHDHSGDAGDGGSFDAANLGSDSASDGQVLTADGYGGAAWENAAGDVLWSTLQGLSLVNEVKNYPALVGMDIDLNAANQWWDIIASPTQAVQMVDCAGEGITETYEWALKSVGDGALDGFYQQYNYADEPRIKSGRPLSAIAAVWLATSSRTLTMKLRTSTGSEVSTTTSMSGGWVILKCENLTLNGTYVVLEFYLNGSGTFYVAPLGVNIGAKALMLPPRGLVYRECVGTAMLVNGVDPGGAGFTDVDCTANSSPLAAKLSLYGLYRNATRVDQTLTARRNGDTTGWGQSALVRSQSTSAFTAGNQIVLCDDGQVFEYMTNCAAADSEAVYIKLLGWWEWA